MSSHRDRHTLPADYAERIRRMRKRLGMTQKQMAARLGVSHITVCRWEKGQIEPSAPSWQQLRRLDEDDEGGLVAEEPAPRDGGRQEAPIDFTANPEAVRAVVEGERLSFGHLENPAFATEVSNIDPLPHQRIAVYDHMLNQPRLRFLLADDAGAGKTIMSGLYIREMLTRRLIRRILIVPPAGLIGNWQRELESLFNIHFTIVTGADAKHENPFVGSSGDRVIVSVDTLAGERVFDCLKDEKVEPYDLVIFDEAHKLSVDRGADMRVRKTDRYKLAESLAGVRTVDAAWQLPWKPQHLLLLTATPHQGKDYPYYGLWRLLDPDVLSTPDAFALYSPDERQRHFIRRTKEEMVRITGEPLYPKRVSDTLGYELSQGPVSEQSLYDQTTAYMRVVYNKARMLNRSAARLAMSVLQRRLASSTFALLRSLERRVEKLDELIHKVEVGELTMEQLLALQRDLERQDDPLDAKTADEECTPGDDPALDDREENEAVETELLAGVIAASLADLIDERDQVVSLLTLARQVHEKGEESKFEKLRELIAEPRFHDEKFIIFTEHRDTLLYLVQRLRGMGFSGQIARIHGGMNYKQRQEEVDRFRKPVSDGGARFMVCTDAAAEGINLQFCWIMVNFDVPWNPSRLEQRMGRIHRYGQKHDPVQIVNLVAPKTREGLVLNTLLKKLQSVRQSLGNDKVFDSIGRIFEGVSLKSYMERAILDGAEAIADEVEGRLTPEQVEALASGERRLYGDGGDVKRQLPRLREDLSREAYRRLMPGYVARYLEHAAPQVGLAIEGDIADAFSLMPTKKKAGGSIFSMIETYPPDFRQRLKVVRPEAGEHAIWVHPGEAVFEAFRRETRRLLGSAALQGAVFVDPTAERPYLFHVAVVNVLRSADPAFGEYTTDEVLECRLVGAKQQEGSELDLCPVEQLLLLRPAQDVMPAAAQRLAHHAGRLTDHAKAFLIDRVARDMAASRRERLLTDLADREQNVVRGFAFQESELAEARQRQAEKARAGNALAQKTLEEIKVQQRSLTERRDAAIAALRREPELITPGQIAFIAHALVVPSQSKEDRERYDADVEKIAMDWARAYEEGQGAEVIDVHTPELARRAGLTDNPGFDLLARYPQGDPRGERAIEVKGRARRGDIEVTDNEWARAANLQGSYWLYVVYDCATNAPRPSRVRNPFVRLLARAKGSLLISPSQIMQEGEQA